MPTLLRLDASTRSTGSRSRELAAHFERAWLARGPDHRVVSRDLVAQSIEHIAELTVTGFYTPAEGLTAQLRDALRLSDELIGELLAADELLIATPMYNFTIPSALKAWIDQVSRTERTFRFDGSRFVGLVPAKRAVVITAYGVGGYLEGGAMAAADYCAPYLRLMLNFLGIPRVEFIGVEGTVVDPAVEQKVTAAKVKIEALAAA